jgi:hypothetical protein
MRMRADRVIELCVLDQDIRSTSAAEQERGRPLLRVVGRLPTALCHLRVRAGVLQPLTTAETWRFSKRPLDAHGLILDPDNDIPNVG